MIAYPRLKSLILREILRTHNLGEPCVTGVTRHGHSDIQAIIILSFPNSKVARLPHIIDAQRKDISVRTLLQKRNDFVLPRELESTVGSAPE
jgi:hypothetical protein